MSFDKDYPVPMTRGSGMGGPRKYSFYEMEIGDSIFVETAREAHSMCCSARTFSSYHGVQFKLVRRRCEGGQRVWRVE